MESRKMESYEMNVFGDTILLVAGKNNATGDMSDFSIFVCNERILQLPGTRFKDFQNTINSFQKPDEVLENAERKQLVDLLRKCYNLLTIPAHMLPQENREEVIDAIADLI